MPADTFLVNVGSPTEATIEQSIATIAHNLARGAQLGCRGVVVHAGSAVGEDRYDDALRQLHERLLPVLDAIGEGGPRLLVEPTAGGGRALCRGSLFDRHGVLVGTVMQEGLIRVRDR